MSRLVNEALVLKKRDGYRLTTLGEWVIKQGIKGDKKHPKQLPAASELPPLKRTGLESNRSGSDSSEDDADTDAPATSRRLSFTGDRDGKETTHDSETGEYLTGTLDGDLKMAIEVSMAQAQHDSADVEAAGREERKAAS